ncbi:hypothetical protein CLOM_g3284 [Closterium sp. NIES-68]|nr:hypothetical protein CLOM_g17087 [Closterium sp. NIES-68]GJP43884.1 hypothetical protein CLOM_g3284 [Closterium sp. NIES-68]GJP68356.1 hypothetical protein CLOP_g25075 [Closterium sp. NIES-67]GJP73076.1 hypothetical protein CLOP_g3827 [Closterium sp. NIES-67]
MPPTKPAPSRNILIAVDPSPDSEKAVAWALKNHIRPSDRVTLLNVRPIVESGPGLFAAYADSTVSAEAMAEVDRVIEKHNAGVRRRFVSNLSQQLDQAKVQYDIVAVQDADPRERICSEVERIKAHTLVMGSRGLSAVKRLVLGSVSDYCVNHASCPVIVVRPKQSEIA